MTRSGPRIVSLRLPQKSARVAGKPSHTTTATSATTSALPPMAAPTVARTFASSASMCSRKDRTTVVRMAARRFASKRIWPTSSALRRCHTTRDVGVCSVRIAYLGSRVICVMANALCAVASCRRVQPACPRLHHHRRYLSEQPPHHGPFDLLHPSAKVPGCVTRSG